MFIYLFIYQKWSWEKRERERERDRWENFCDEIDENIQQKQKIGNINRLN